MSQCSRVWRPPPQVQILLLPCLLAASLGQDIFTPLSLNFLTCEMAVIPVPIWYYTSGILQRKESGSCSVMSGSLRPHGLNSPWNSSGQNTGVGSFSLLQDIFPTQGLNSGLLHCRQILYQLSHKGSLILQDQLHFSTPF